MSDFADEKFRMASLISVSNAFTVADIITTLETNYIPDALYTVIGELLESKLLEFSEQPQLTFDRETLTTGVAQVKVYQLIQGKRNEFERYMGELNRLRLLPDAHGKPRGLSFRVLEQLIEGISAHPDSLEEKDSLIQQYLASAETEEISEQLDDRQRALSEAYLRELYGKYLEIKHDWVNAVLQFFRAGQLFVALGLSEKHLVIASRISTLIVHKYNAIKKSAFYQIEDLLLDFKQQLDTIMNVISDIKDQYDKVLFITDYILHDIESIMHWFQENSKNSDLLTYNPILPITETEAQQPLLTREYLKIDAYRNQFLPDLTAVIPSPDSIVANEAALSWGSEGKKNMNLIISYLDHPVLSA